MKIVLMIMAVNEVNTNPYIVCSIGTDTDDVFSYLGSVNVPFVQFYSINKMLKLVPSSYLIYKSEKWDNYLKEQVLKAYG